MTPHEKFAGAVQTASGDHTARLGASLTAWADAITEHGLARPKERTALYRDADTALRAAADNSMRLLIEDRQRAVAAFSLAIGGPVAKPLEVENFAALVDRFMAQPDRGSDNRRFRQMFERRYFDLVFDHPDATDGIAATIANAMKGILEDCKAVKDFQFGTPTNIVAADRALIQNVTSALRLIARAKDVDAATRAEAGDLAEELTGAAVTEAQGLAEKADSGNPPAPAITIADASAKASGHAAQGLAGAPMSDAQRQAARDQWAKLYPGREAEFDAALKGESPIAPMSAAQSDAAEAPKPDPEALAAYSPDYGAHGRTLPPDQLRVFNAHAVDLAAKLGLPSTVGKALLEHCMSRAREFSAMSAAARALRENSDKLGVTPEQITLAAQALRRAGANKLLTELLARKAFSPWALRTLANFEKVRA